MPLLSVYNHLMQGYAMMRPTRFDSHKRSELKNVYQNIMRMTAEQPLYKVSFDESAQAYTLGIKNSALSLSSTVKELNIDDGTSVFQSRTLASSDPDTVDISMLTGSDIRDSSLPLNIGVSALSSSQENEGLLLPEQESSLPSGQYSFTIGVENNMYSFQFNVSAGATNLELQQKLSDFINKTSIGLRTQIVREPESGTARLDLSAIAHGTAVSGSPVFTPQDVRYPNNAAHGVIAHFGLGRIVHMPENTAFTINGKEFQTRGHSYTTDQGLSLSFHRTTEEPVVVSKVTDHGPIADKVQSFVEGYNSFSELASKNAPASLRAKKLVYDLHNTIRGFAPEMEACGILISRDGTLSMDREAVYAAADDGSLEHFFSSENNFASSLLKKLSDISLNPMEYLDKTIITYPNTSAKKTFSPYISSVYSGLLFNNYC